MADHRPALWDSGFDSAQRGHAADWQICLAHQLRDCQFAVEAGGTIWPKPPGANTVNGWNANSTR